MLLVGALVKKNGAPRYVVSLLRALIWRIFLIDLWVDL